jgi:hypothetical protein
LRGLEEVQLLCGGGLDEGVLGKEVVEEGRPALFRSDDDETGQRSRRWLLVPWPRFLGGTELAL